MARPSLAFLHALGLVLALLGAGCPPPKAPGGPAPEYEEPPAPPWLDAGATDATSASPPAAVDGTPVAPGAPDAGGS